MHGAGGESRCPAPRGPFLLLTEPLADFLQLDELRQAVELLRAFGEDSRQYLRGLSQHLGKHRDGHWDRYRDREHPTGG